MSATGTPARSAMAIPSPVASVGIGRDRVHLPGPAAGEEDVVGLDAQQVAGGVERDDAGAAAALAHEVEGEPVLQDRRGAVAHRRDEGPLDLGAGGEPAGVQDARRRVATFPATRTARRRGPGRRRRRARSARARARSPRRRAPARPPGRTSPAPARRVSARCRSVESSSPGSTAAMPPWAQRVVDCSSSPLVSTPTLVLPTWARRTAAERPATPLPTTRTSRRRSWLTPWCARRGGATAGRAAKSCVHPQVVDQANRPDLCRDEQSKLAGEGAAASRTCRGPPQLHSPTWPAARPQPRRPWPSRPPSRRARRRRRCRARPRAP